MRSMTDLSVKDTTAARATREIMERLLMSVVREGPGVVAPESGGLSLIPPGSPPLYVPIGHYYSMRRFDLADWPRAGGVNGTTVESVEELLRLLHPNLKDDARARLLAEVENSRANTESSLRALEATGIGEPGQGTLADWEGRVWMGHPLHPGARLRSGLDETDNRRFGPEWQVTLELPLIEIPREDLVLEGELEATLASLYPGLPREERLAVPVHPWAAERDLPSRFAEQFQSGRWKLSSHRPLRARPSMSFRSVILEGGDFHLKLPVAVQTTGATRTVSVSAAHNGPLMSHFLGQLWQLHGVSKKLNRLSLMAESASFRLAEHGDNNRFLAGLLRRGPGPSVDGKRWLLPAAALLEPRENPLFARAASHYGLTPRQLWSDYVNALVPPVAFLCGRLGVALEAHPQNVVVEFSGPAGQRPEVRFHYRDLGGIRLHAEQLRRGLAQMELEIEVPTLYPGSATATNSLRDLSSKFIYSLLQNHLGELLRAIVRHTGDDETPYWETVRTVLETHRAALGEDLAERVFADEWDLKAMWRMRIDSAVTEYTYAPVANPWSRA